MLIIHMYIIDKSPSMICKKNCWQHNRTPAFTENLEKEKIPNVSAQDMIRYVWICDHRLPLAYLVATGWSVIPLWATSTTLSRCDFSNLIHGTKLYYFFATPLPDLSCLYFFLWKQLKNLIYATPIESEKEGWLLMMNCAVCLVHITRSQIYILPLVWVHYHWVSLFWRVIVIIYDQTWFASFMSFLCRLIYLFIFLT